MAADTVKIAWKGVDKSFGSNDVLKGLDLKAYEGRSLVVIGGSGSGKSVTIKLALGLLKPDAGKVEIDGQPVRFAREDDPGVQQIGMLFQSGALFDSLPVWRNIAFRLLYAQNMDTEEAREAAIDALAQVDLGPETADLDIGELSGGMEKRVALARAVVGKPNILFFDEPTTGLDPVTADLINQLISRQVKQLGATAVTITHDMASMRAIADEVAFLKDGSIHWRGDRDDLKTCDNEEVSAFIEGRYSGGGSK